MFSIGALSDFCLDVYEVSDEDFSETQPLPLNVTEQLDGVLLRHRISILSRIDVSALLPKIEIPILYLHGTQDRIVSETGSISMRPICCCKPVHSKAPNLSSIIFERVYNRRGFWRNT
jgi:pimeloyl-ACP methyl ester carboxylesterase